MVRAQTAWGSRDGADDDDAYRMIRVTQKQQEATEHWPMGMCSRPRFPSYERCDFDRNLFPVLLNSGDNPRDQP